jgi:undecaprenyl-diphosphatase
MVGLRRFGARVLLTVFAVALGAVPFIILGVVVHTEGTAANRLDVSVADSLHRWVGSTPGMAAFLRMVSTVFAPNVFRAVLVVAAVLMIRRARRLAIWILVTVAGEAALDVSLKAVFGRVRPSFKDPLVHAGGGSYPSGHAFGSLVGCAIIVLVVLPLLSGGWRRVVVVATTLVVLLVGFSRVGLGAHYVTDVLGGWLVGAAWVSLTTAAFQSWREDVGLRRSHPAKGGIEPELARELSPQPGAKRAG